MTPENLPEPFMQLARMRGDLDEAAEIALKHISKKAPLTDINFVYLLLSPTLEPVFSHPKLVTEVVALKERLAKYRAEIEPMFSEGEWRLD